jgi:hypothetical protein
LRSEAGGVVFLSHFFFAEYLYYPIRESQEPRNKKQETEKERREEKKSNNSLLCETPF